MKYRAFWLDVKSGRAVELKRGDGETETHMQFVLEHPARFGLDAERVGQLRPEELPYEISEYPEWIVRPLLARFVKVNVDDRYVSFTVTDRLTRQHMEAMQQFLEQARLTHLHVFMAGEPSGKMISRATAQEFLDIGKVAELRRLVAAPGGKGARFRIGQVWRRHDGLMYRLSRRVEGGWHVMLGQDGAVRRHSTAEWGFTDRHFHNIVASEQLRLMHDPPAGLASVRKHETAGLLRRSFSAIDEIERPELRQAQDAERRLRERLETEDNPDLRRQMELVQDVLKQKGPVVEEPDPVTSPHMVSREGVTKPNRVSR